MRCRVQTSCLRGASPLRFSDQRLGSGLLANFLKRPSKGVCLTRGGRAGSCPGFCSLGQWSGREFRVPTVYFSSSR